MPEGSTPEGGPEKTWKKAERKFTHPSAWCPERVITLSRYYVATRAPRELRATLPCGTGKLLKQLTKPASEFYDPCQDFADRSLKCLKRNNFEREMCGDYFQ
ncbi:unnamed protein product [Penicillium manginii]